MKKTYKHSVLCNFHRKLFFSPEIPAVCVNWPSPDSSIFAHLTWPNKDTQLPTPFAETFIFPRNP